MEGSGTGVYMDTFMSATWGVGVGTGPGGGSGVGGVMTCCGSAIVGSDMGAVNIGADSATFTNLGSVTLGVHMNGGVRCSA